MIAGFLPSTIFLTYTSHRSGSFFSKALLEEEEFEDEWREKSIVEDYWKAENYRQLHKKLRQAHKSENGRILFDTVVFV